MKVNCPHCGTEYDADKSEMYRYVKCEVCGNGFVAGASAKEARAPLQGVGSEKGGRCARPRSNRKAPTASNPSRFAPTQGPEGASSSKGKTRSDLPTFPSESVCCKAWFGYWLKRLLIVVGMSAVVGFICGFVAVKTGCAFFVAWPKEPLSRFWHSVSYVAVAGAIVISWYLCFVCYKKTLCKIVKEELLCCIIPSWLVGVLVNVALTFLMPNNIQMSVLGAYGFVVWGLTIWVGVDYCLFRFVSLRMVLGKRIDTRWICPALLFGIFILLMYGFTNVISRSDLHLRGLKEMDDSRHNDASQIYDRMKAIDDSRHNDASQIYDRMGRMKLY